MGLRDLLKGTAKALLHRDSARAEPPRPPAPASPPVTSAPVTSASPPAPSAPNTDASRRPDPRARRAGLPADEDGWRAVAPSDRVAEGRAGTFPLEGSTIVAVFRKDGRLWCIDNACAHEDGPVGEGEIRGCHVKCPYHDWEYDFTTGACLTDPERPLATWAVREKDGFVWIGPRLTDGTHHRGGDHNDGLETIIR